jgi:adenine-specific DNA-methyltransferase
MIPASSAPVLAWTGKAEGCTGVGAPVPRIVRTLDGSPPDRTANLLVHGENLAALTALSTTHAGAVKLAYLDPPYNTGGRFTHYDDDRAHADWLGFLHARLLALRPLLRDDGLVVAQIDDHEQAYLQVLLDEVFGRANRVNTVVVKMSELSGLKMTHTGARLPKLKEYLLVHGKSAAAGLASVRVPRVPEALETYLRYYAKVIVNPDDPAESWRIVPIVEHLATLGQPTDAARVRAFKLAHPQHVVYRTNNRSLGTMHFPTATARVTTRGGRSYVWWEGKQMLFLADHLDTWLGDLWTDVSTINLNKEGGVGFPNGKKPEALVRRILTLATVTGDLVLDPFLGSGTTAAVAHAMGRAWIGIEVGPQALTHCAPRVAAVLDAVGGTVEHCRVTTDCG